MAYVVKLFDGLEVPEYITRGDSQDMGTGSALTNFLPLPGGGFYDNYKSRKSPQGIRPVSKSGVLWGTTAELIEQLDAWRGKIGVRGRLVIEMDDGTLRWQWARLQDVSAPRPSNAKGGWLPFTLTWITVAQDWRGIVFLDDGWTWGDETWTFGDGSAEFGTSAQSFNVVSSGTIVTLEHGGNIDATRLSIRFEMTGSWEDLTIINRTTGQTIALLRDAPNSTSWVEVDTGRRSIYFSTDAVDITSASRSQNTLTVLASHGAATGEGVRLFGTVEYDGDYYPATVLDSATLTVPLPPRHPGYGTVTDGTLRRLVDRYSFATISDKERWMVLAPGDNDIQIVWNDAPATATMIVEYADHYA